MKRRNRISKKSVQNKESKKAQPKILYAQINKNLLNFPLARDVRTAPEWWFSKKPGRWFCNVSRNPKVTLWLPSWTDEGLYRCPTARDMNVFTYLLGAGTLAMEPRDMNMGLPERKRANIAPPVNFHALRHT